MAAPAGARAADPALEALRHRDAYVSPRVLGARAAAEERRLAAAAEGMRSDGRPVKLAVVLGPVGSPSLQVYVRRLAGRLHFGGTLVITNRGRTIAAAGPRATADITRALRAARVGRVIDPATRLTRAADVAAPAATDLEDAGRRSTIVLIVLAVLGGGWAAAIAIGNHGRRARLELTEARGRARVYADTLRAHTMALARRPDLPEGARESIQHALGVYADAVSSLPEMRQAEDVVAFGPRIRTALDEIAATSAEVCGAPVPADPFAGLCGMDPAHGPAVVTPPGSRAMCDACREAWIRGERVVPRMLFEGGRPVPFDQATYGAALRPEPEE